MPLDADYRAAFYTACEVIMELGQDLGVKENWQDIIGYLASHFIEKAAHCAVQHGQIVGMLIQEKRNLETECARLRERLAVAEAALTVPAIPYRA